ncbi:hypothetical protein [Azospirillum argentinense]|uniref:DUF2190 domain-containing protein n=1 Tax=Azospirillum brasilense TaxID=192 RepID=A0A4D8QKL2_AZOBR|nr:hypothetical protein [Azospirillum argentinense]QCO07399.1 hypothetical protein D3867_36615 [Azospirillum argentinense]
MSLPYEANMTRIGTFTAGVDLSDHQYKAVMLSTAADDSVIPPSGQGAMCIGILQNAPKAGSKADVCVFGITRAVGGATVTRGARVTANGADGEIGAASSGDYVLGVLTQGTADGVEQSMFVNPQFVPLA